MSDLENDVCILCQMGFIVKDRCNTCGVNYIDCSDLNAVYDKINELMSRPDEGDEFDD